MNTIFSTSGFPPVSYMVYMLLAENAIIDLGEDYVKQSYRNRYNIYTASGKLALTIPVTKPNGNHTAVHRVKLSDHEPWQRTHFRTIKAAYQNSPYYIHYIDEIKILVETETQSLVQYNEICFKGICDLMDIPLSYSKTETYYETDGIDFRNQISPKRETPVSKLLNEFSYHQVFAENHGFIKDLSILDILFNLGPEGASYIHKITEAYLKASAG